MWSSLWPLWTMSLLMMLYFLIPQPVYVEQFVAIADYVPVDDVIFSIPQPVYVEQFVAIADYVPVDDVIFSIPQPVYVEQFVAIVDYVPVDHSVHISYKISVHFFFTEP